MFLFTHMENALYPNKLQQILQMIYNVINFIIHLLLYQHVLQTGHADR